MTIAALAPSGTGSPDGLAYDVVSKVNEVVDAVNATDVISTSVPDVAITSLGAQADHTATTAIAATYADVAAARTSVNALRTNVETALGEHDTEIDVLASKIDAILAMLRTVGIIET